MGDTFTTAKAWLLSLSWAVPTQLSSLSVVSAEDPPMAVVRKFVHLLDQSDQDFQEELDLMKLREEVVTLIRSNQQLENDLNLMDIKIGLLVKNKITLQVQLTLPAFP